MSNKTGQNLNPQFTSMQFWWRRLLKGILPTSVLILISLIRTSAQITNSCVPVPPGAIAWWPGESNADDIIGGNDGILKGGARYGTGEVGLAFLFDTNTSAVQIAATPNLNVGIGPGFTVEAWIDISGSLSANPIFEWNNDAGTYGVHFWEGAFSAPGTLYANLVDINGTSHIIESAGGAMTTNVFTHVALTYDQASGVATIYCDGVQVAQQTLGSFTPQTTYDLYLGNRPSGANAGSFSGRIDEGTLYDRALSQSEIQDIYNAGSAGKCLPTCAPPSSGLVSWWPAEENTLDVISGNDGILENGATYGLGEVGLAFLFDTNTSAVRIPATTSLNVGAGLGFTVEAWICISNSLAGNPIFEWNNDTGTYGVHFWEGAFSVPGTLYANLVDSSGTSHIIESPGNMVTTNEFAHVALTYDHASGVATIYCDGVQVAQQTLGSFTPQTTYDLYLGDRPSGANAGSFEGLIDEATLYSRALSQAEIQAIYNAGSAGKCR